MGKLLKVLVVIFLLLSLVALGMGYLLFGKRELLKGRTQKLEEAVIAVGTTIEAEDPAPAAPPDYPVRDLSPAEMEADEEIEFSDFWDDYRPELEALDLPPLDLKQKRTQLSVYYKTDPATGKIERDEYGRRKTAGAGTMQELLDLLLGRAEQQYNRLNETRQQLINVRKELGAVIRDANDTKADLRVALAEIDDLEAEVADLKSQIEPLKRRIATLEEEKRALNDQLAEEQRQSALLRDAIVDKDAEIARLKQEIEDLRKRIGMGTGRTREPRPDLAQDIEPGVKGEVVAVNEDWSFVVVKLTDAFLRELLGEDLSGGLPENVDLVVARAGEAQDFVTKIRLRRVRREENLAIADVLTDWQQVPVKKGDVVFF